MNISTGVNEWLRLQPNDDEIEMIEGVNIIRQKIIEELLDIMTDQNWSTRNYQSKYFKVGDVDYISASLELVVNYHDDNRVLIQRTFVGAVSFQLSFFSGQHIDNTAKSLCIVNAASEIGNRLGRNLNQSVQPVIEGKLSKAQQKVKAAVKVAPDAGIKAQWNEAVQKNNVKKAKYLFGFYNIIPGENGFDYINTDTDAS